MSPEKERGPGAASPLGDGGPASQGALRHTANLAQRDRRTSVQPSQERKGDQRPGQGGVSAESGEVTPEPRAENPRT